MEEVWIIVKINLKVEGLSCGLCAITIENVLQELGVKGSVDLKRATVSLEYDEHHVSLEKIETAVKECGYQVFHEG
ncbi:heavy-metal-associated domain-containing protein [Pseudalkalibacillus salsuginis]|uniref:heavy-metal-associated domain-containing protein n=1 Tax=Pseudalkalibacillus salsuginis TaxID=2910972 RepID=UPI001F178421|nr:cation transporter [Pseudalkalibacillus salsuginis]MCF6410373.1 cation transporter [Pseudalkalibacillus salsuginis]